MQASTLTAIASVVIVLLGMELGRAMGGQESDRQWGPETQGCRLSAMPDRPSYRFDQPIRLHLVLENVGNRPVRVRHTDLMVIYRVDVRLPNGEPAPLTLEGKRQTFLQGTSENFAANLLPGQTDVGYVAMLNRLYDMTLLGEYTVTVYRRYVWLPVGKPESFDVQSNTLTIVLHEKEVTDDEGEAECQ